MIETIVGQPIDLSIDAHNPQIRSLICVFVALMGIGFNNKSAAVGTPRRGLNVYSEIRDLLWCSAGSRQNIELFGWRRRRVARIG